MTRKEQYIEFLKSKMVFAPETGINFNVGIINFKDGTVLKPHQRDGINWAIRGGRRAIFESFGLGKTIQQLIICDAIIRIERGRGLIICPLGVRQEFRKDAEFKLGVDLFYVRSMEEVSKTPANAICITNYERVRDGDIDPKYFTVCCLDEASVLRSDNSKTHHTFIQKFKGVRFKYVATATPSPNEFIELIFYAAFLEIMDKGQCKTRFFKRDSTKADSLTLHEHKTEEFWLWLSTWALFVTKPSDLGYDDSGYDLPEMEIIYHEIPVDHSKSDPEKDGQYTMLRSSAKGLGPAAREKRDSLTGRVAKMVEIVKSDPDSHYILWHDLEAERMAIKKALPECVEVYGSQDIDIREQSIIDFSEGKIKYLATKPEISGQGCNFQYHCHDAIFTGIGYKFNDFIQAIHRILRFQQKHKVRIHIIYAESEREILEKLLEKWDNYKRLVSEMVRIIKTYGLSSVNVEEKLRRSMGVERRVVEGDHFKAIYNDCTLETMNMETNSMDLIHSSFPFSIQYEYTPSYNDFGHNKDNQQFFNQLDFLIPELHRVLRPGRIAAIHVKDRIEFGNFTGNGFPSLYPFSDETVRAFTKHGFVFFGRITVVTDVVRENNQTYRLGWSEVCKDGTKMGVGLPEYVLLFRKLPTDTSKAYADVPVLKSKKEYTRARWQIDAHGFWRSSGDRFFSPEEMKALEPKKLQKYFKMFSSQNVYNYEQHVKIAEDLENAGKLPSGWMMVAPESTNEDVWTDITRIKTLNTAQSMGRKQMHLCPLQFDIVDRIIERYTNPGETVYDPFGGIGTVSFRAIKLNRKGVMCELNPDYFNDSLVYQKAAEYDQTVPTLFNVENLQTA